MLMSPEVVVNSVLMSDRVEVVPSSVCSYAPEQAPELIAPSSLPGEVYALSLSPPVQLLQSELQPPVVDAIVRG